MKSLLTKVHGRLPRYFMAVLLASTLFFSCKDVYYYDDYEPDWLGDNIYAYLEEDGRFDYTLKLINDLDYATVMKLTGSITLFAATDSSYEEFFKDNEWGVSSYDQLTNAQKRILFKYGMINNAYLTGTIVNFYNGTYNENVVMRRTTNLDIYDSLPFVKGEDMPDFSYWDDYRGKGIYMMKDETVSPITLFTDDFLNKQSITNEDFFIFTGGTTRSSGDYHLFNVKVVTPDIVCKNGYVNIIESVLLPPKNMAQYIKDNPNTSIFSKLLDRFSAPYYNSAITESYKTIYKELTGNDFTDSIFVLKYFADKGGTTELPSGTEATNKLVYDPGWNSYTASDLETDMAAMFVPTDDAMTAYLNSPVGEILGERFDWSWDNIPDDIVLPFIKRHMRSSFIESVPSRFLDMVDAENYDMPVENSHIEETYTGVNGQVYVTNEVYPPVDYISVFSPVLLSSNTNVMKWAIEITETSDYDGTEFAFYKLYLNSLVSDYSLFIPTDDYFKEYIDPIAYGQDVPAVIKYWYNDTKTTTLSVGVVATIYRYDKTTGVVGDSVGFIQDADFLKNRLWHILDGHVVVGDVESGNSYYVTKGNDIIKVQGTGTSMKVQGGYDNANDKTCQVTDVFRQDNGSTYFLDKPIQSALGSVYKVLSETPQFQAFFDLLNGVPDTCVSQIFYQDGVDYRINFFSAFRYTVYVPVDTAIQGAIKRGVISPWDSIYAISDDPTLTTAQQNTKRYTEIQKMIRFLRYHFQDEAVFVGQATDDTYQSATIKLNGEDSHFNTAKNKYYKIGVVSDANSMTLTTETNNKVHVITTSDKLYNIIAKDYFFDDELSNYKNVDGTGTSGGTAFSESLITTSSSAVIHLVDNVMTFQ